MPAREASSASLKRAAAALRALGHPDRLRIALALATREACVCELVEQLGMRQPAISQHLSVLRQAGLVASRRDGLFVRYRLRGPVPGRILAALDLPVPAQGRQASDGCGTRCTSDRGPQSHPTSSRTRSRDDVVSTSGR